MRSGDRRTLRPRPSVRALSDSRSALNATRRLSARPDSRTALVPGRGLRRGGRILISTVRPRLARPVGAAVSESRPLVRPAASRGGARTSASPMTLRRIESTAARSEPRTALAPVTIPKSSPVTATVLLARGLLASRSLAPRGAGSIAPAGRRRMAFPTGSSDGGVREAPRASLGRVARVGSDPRPDAAGRRAMRSPRGASPGTPRREGARFALIANGTRANSTLDARARHRGVQAHGARVATGARTRVKQRGARDSESLL